MQIKGRRAYAMLASVVLVLAAHRVLIYLAFQGLPVVYTRPMDKGLWLAGAVGRIVLYMGLGAILIACWRQTMRSDDARWVLCVPYGILASAYWLVLDQAALFALLGPDLTKAWLQWVWRRPLLSDLYWGWGATTYHWHFVAVQAAASAGALLLVDLRTARRPQEAHS